MGQRIHAVAASELGSTVVYDHTPLAINEIIQPEFKNRGHFISFLFQCRLTGPLEKGSRYTGGIAIPGQWAWHDTCPDNLITVQEMYRPYISTTSDSIETNYDL